jgi:hypothetical protein
MKMTTFRSQLFVLLGPEVSCGAPKEFNRSIPFSIRLNVSIEGIGLEGWQLALRNCAAQKAMAKHHLKGQNGVSRSAT